MKAKTKYPFKEGDVYYTIENLEVIASVWDDVSEEMHDMNPEREYYLNEGDANWNRALQMLPTIRYELLLALEIARQTHATGVKVWMQKAMARLDKLAPWEEPKRPKSERGEYPDWMAYDSFMSGEVSGNGG